MISQLIVGMPASGKSTYIAALRHLLLANTVVTSLELTGLADEEQHLNRLENEWLRCEEVDRTRAATEGWVELRVRDRDTRAPSILIIPDLRGETFEQPLCIGKCQSDLYDAVGGADGLMLFTNADRADDAMMISDLGDLIGPDSAGNPVSTPFKAEDMPEEAKLIELLQMANRRPLRSRKRRLVVAVSAWDVVEDGLTPEAWLAVMRPMLDQFLAFNSDLWEVRVYGVSAQGGRLPDERRRLSRLKSPSERIKLVGHGAASHDLTAPLSWLSSG